MREARKREPGSFFLRAEGGVAGSALGRAGRPKRSASGSIPRIPLRTRNASPPGARPRPRARGPRSWRA